MTQKRKIKPNLRRAKLERLAARDAFRDMRREYGTILVDALAPANDTQPIEARHDNAA